MTFENPRHTIRVMTRKAYLTLLLTCFNGCSSNSAFKADPGEDASTPTLDSTVAIEAGSTREALPVEASLDVTQPESLADAPSAKDIALLDGPWAADHGNDDAPLSNDEGDGDLAGRTDEVGVDVPSTMAAVDTRPQEVLVDASYAENYQCRDNSDCCIAVLYTGYCTGFGGDKRVFLYSRAPGAAPAPSSTTTEPCYPATFYECPKVRVRCISGQCVAKSEGLGSVGPGNYCGDSTLDGGDAIGGSGDTGSFIPVASWVCTIPPG